MRYVREGKDERKYDEEGKDVKKKGMLKGRELRQRI